MCSTCMNNAQHMLYGKTQQLVSKISDIERLAFNLLTITHIPYTHSESTPFIASSFRSFNRNPATNANTYFSLFYVRVYIFFPHRCAPCSMLQASLPQGVRLWTPWTSVPLGLVKKWWPTWDSPQTTCHWHSSHQTTMSRYVDQQIYIGIATKVLLMIASIFTILDIDYVHKSGNNHITSH